MGQDTPNILWICTDQQRFDTIGVLGNENIKTPNIDRLVKEGVAFLRAYTQNPICTPSRASFLTGRYPSTLHVNRNGDAWFPDRPGLITRILRDAGYDCGLSGKLHLTAAHGRVEHFPEDKYGYRVLKWSHHPNPENFWPTAQHDYQKWLEDNGIIWQDAYNADLTSDAGKSWNVPGVCRPGIAAEFHQTTWCADEAIAFMLEEREGPWLMSVNPFDPHPAFDPPLSYLEKMDPASIPLPLFRNSELVSQLAFAGIEHQTESPRSPYDYDAQRMVAAYYAQILLIDDQVGRMLDALENSGQRENTIIIFTSDHGEMLGDHGLVLKGCRFYEGAVHIPLIFSWPGHFKSDLRSQALVELTDIVPTLLDIVGLPVSDHIQGKSLLPILIGDADSAYHREYVRCEYHDALDRSYASHANMLRTEKYKLVVYHGHEVGELYDLDEDPDEFCNLWDEADMQPVKSRFIKRLFDATMLAVDEGIDRVGGF
jgi:arylsulfatase